MIQSRSLCLGLLTSLLVSGVPMAALAPKPTTAAKPAQTSAAKKAPLQAPVKVTSVEGITEYRLANGLRVLLFPDPGKPTITVNVTYLVGSCNENYGETGMAHLLEHMVFKGTKKYTGEKGSKTPVEILNELGARFNGSTSFDRTNYFITFPATPSNLDQILDLEVERMGNSLIRGKDLWDKETQKGEMTVVRNEYESGENDPVDVTLQRALSVAFDWHNYGKSTIGCKTDIENVNIDHLRAFYQRYYAPDNAVLMISGKIDETQVLAKVNESFGKLTKPTRQLEPLYTVEPVQDGERSVTVRRVGDTPLIMAGYKTPSALDPQGASMQVLTQVMTSEPSGRLYKALVDTKKASYVFPINYSMREPGIAFFGTILAKEQNPEEAKTILLKTLEDVASQPITQEEVDRAKVEFLKSVDLLLNQSDRLGINLSEYIAQGDWRLFFLHRDQVKAVTAASVQQVASNYFRVSNRTFAQFIPTEKPVRAEFPVQAEAAVLLKDYQGQAAVSQGETFDVAYAAIDGRTQKFNVGPALKLSVVPRKNRGSVVSAVLNLHFGDEQSLQGQGVAGSLCVDMLMRGSAKHTRQQIKDEFDRLKSQVSVYGGAEKATARITTTRENLPATLTLLAEVLKTPAFPDSEFATLIQEQVADIQYSRSEPQAVGGLAFSQHFCQYPKGHVRYVSNFDEQLTDLKQAKLEDLKAFHRDFFGATGEISLVGDVDPKATAELLGTLLGDWKPVKPFTRITDKLSGAPPVDQVIETPDKANAFMMAGFELPLKDDDADYPAMLLGNYLIGGGALKSRLADRIRQKEGLSYGVRSYLDAYSEDRAGAWGAYAIYNPANVDKLIAAFKDELALVLKEGFKAEEIASAKLSWKQGLEVGRSQETSLASQLAAQLRVKRSMVFDADLEAKVMALTNGQILSVLQKRLDLSRITFVKAGDFAKAAKAETKK